MRGFDKPLRDIEPVGAGKSFTDAVAPLLRCVVPNGMRFLSARAGGIPRHPGTTNADVPSENAGPLAFKPPKPGHP